MLVHVCIKLSIAIVMFHAPIFSDHIRDQETESWLTLLKSRDQCMRDGLSEEELREIHADIFGKVKESIADVKQKVAVEQQQQQQQNMQATSKLCLHYSYTLWS